MSADPFAEFHERNLRDLEQAHDELFDSVHLLLVERLVTPPAQELSLAAWNRVIDAHDVLADWYRNPATGEPRQVRQRP